MKVGILGAGSMGAAHAAAWRSIDGSEIAGIFSRDGARARTMAGTFGTAPAVDPHVLLDDPAVDAIDICLPSRCHAEFALAALARGKHVFCETPFALGIAEAEAMIAAARRADRYLAVGLLMRAVAPYQYVREKVAAGTHGRLLSLAMHRLGSYLRPGASDHKPHYGEPSIELMTFDFDAAAWLLGKPRRLTAAATNLAADRPGEITALLDFGDGRQATIAASGMLPAGFTFRTGFRALFEGGAYVLETTFDRLPPSSRFEFYPADGPPQPVALAGHDPYAWELRHFADGIAGQADRDLLAPEHALAALKLSLATQRSLRERRTIDLV
ncbi:MAG TPA: Gfo/Idh/MocA family oxidoreductase [Candidatus Sulfotelmatobacter sp.]|nr:Gfo/Idh/MocA family oxidoreductase [Candidatus Sulfotelmatobacter sp.]